MPKILLLTDIPPMTNYTGGLFLTQLCRFLPKGTIACYTVQPYGLQARISPEFDWMPIAYDQKPLEYVAPMPPPFSRLDTAFSFAQDRYNALIPTKAIVQRAVKFARE